MGLVVVHQLVQVHRHVTGDGADVDVRAAAAQRRERGQHRLLRGAGAQRVDDDVGALAAGEAAYPVGHRLLVVEGMDLDPPGPAWRTRSSRSRSRPVPRTLRAPSARANSATPEPEGAADAVDQHRAARADAGAPQRPVRRTEVAPAGGRLVRDVVRQLDQAVLRGGHVLGQPAVRVVVEQRLGLRAEPEVAVERVVACSAVVSPVRQSRQPPQYRAGLTYTRWPISMPCTCEPFSTTTPVGSRPKIAGSGGRGRCGNQSTKLSSTLPRFGHDPAGLDLHQHVGGARGGDLDLVDLKGFTNGVHARGAHCSRHRCLPFSSGTT